VLSAFETFKVAETPKNLRILVGSLGGSPSERRFVFNEACAKLLRRASRKLL